MALLRDSAVVLRRLDYSETSQVLVFFTREHGKVRAIGKGTKRGTKKRFAVGIDLLDVGDIMFSNRQERGPGLATLTEWKQTRSLSGLRERLSRLRAAEYTAEITSHLTEDWDPHPALFDALIATLNKLGDSGDPLPLVVTFQRCLLVETGTLPRFDACVQCGRSDDLTHFSSHEGGMVCLHCEPHRVEKRQVSPDTLQALRGDTPEADPVPLFVLLNYHIAHLMGQDPRLATKLVSRLQQRTI